MEIGKVINQLDQDTESLYDAKGIPVPVWGNWCGPNYGGGTPKDLLDTACMYHDKDYARHGYFDCGSDARLIQRINNWYDDMATMEKYMANQVKLYFYAQMAVNC